MADERQQLNALVENINKEWFGYIMYRDNVKIFQRLDVMDRVIKLLKMNNDMARIYGRGFQVQFDRIFLDVLFVYRESSLRVREAGNPMASILRLVKGECLEFIDTFLGKLEDIPEVGLGYLYNMKDDVFGNYASKDSADARESRVLSLSVTIINRLNGLEVLSETPEDVLGNVLGCTLEMMRAPHYPEHQHKFLLLLRAIATHSFPTRHCYLSTDGFLFFMQSIVWAVKNAEPDIAENGLNILLTILQNIKDIQLCNEFFQGCYAKIEPEIWTVLANKLRIPGFALHEQVLHVQVLFLLYSPVNMLTTTLRFSPNIVHNLNINDNRSFAWENTTRILRSLFPGMAEHKVSSFATEVFKPRRNVHEFTLHEFTRHMQTLILD